MFCVAVAAARERFFLGVFFHYSFSMKHTGFSRKLFSKIKSNEMVKYYSVRRNMSSNNTETAVLF